MAFSHWSVSVFEAATTVVDILVGRGRFHQIYLTKDVSRRLRKILNVIIAIFFSILLQSMCLCQS